jgi:hypothetical protein
MRKETETKIRVYLISTIIIALLNLAISAVFFLPPEVKSIPINAPLWNILSLLKAIINFINLVYFAASIYIILVIFKNKIDKHILVVPIVEVTSTILAWIISVVIVVYTHYTPDFDSTLIYSIIIGIGMILSLFCLFFSKYLMKHYLD